jgi:hypothetical protein
MFHPVGHTHSRVDALFSRVSVALSSSDILTVQGDDYQVGLTSLSVILLNTNKQPQCDLFQIFINAYYRVKKPLVISLSWLN